MKLYKLLTISLSALLLSCSDDNKRLDPTDKDRNWFNLEDSPDELEHLRYEIFRETGITILYSDTLGFQDRGVNDYGDRVIHYEILNPGYIITSASNEIYYSFFSDRAAIKNGVTFLKEYVIPKLTPTIYPRSYLLVEKLVLNATMTLAQGRRDGEVYKGLMTTVANTGTLASISTEGKRKLGGAIVAPEWYNYLIQHNSSDLDRFYDVSEHSVDLTGYTVTTVYDQRTHTSTGAYLPFTPSWHAYGFLSYDPNDIGTMERFIVGGEYTRWFSPTKQQDAEAFIAIVQAYSESEFHELYKDEVGVEHLVAKYRILKEVMDNIKNNR